MLIQQSFNPTLILADQSPGKCLFCYACTLSAGPRSPRNLIGGMNELRMNATISRGRLTFYLFASLAEFERAT